MKVIKNFINYINESSDSDKELIDSLLPDSIETVGMNRRGGLLFPSVNGEDSKVRILSKAGMKKWESDFMDMYGKKPKYRVTDTEPVTVEITNNFFREKKDRFSRGKHEFLNDPGFRDSSKD